MIQEKYLTYRGRISAAVGQGKTLIFTTVHPEGLPTAVYRVDFEKHALKADPLPAGGRRLAVRDDFVWIAATDGKLLRQPSAGGAVTATGAVTGADPVGLVPLVDGMWGVAAGNELAIVGADGRKVLKTFELEAPASALAADPTGQWIAVGTRDGNVTIFDREEKSEFLKGESAKLHEGAVRVLWFEPEELRFWSAGIDRKLLQTHARGKLEPEDRGGSNMHDEPVTAILPGPGDRLFTASGDKSIKNWARISGGRPSSLKDGLVAVEGLALVSIHERPHLVAWGEDGSLRPIGIDAAGKLGSVVQRVYGLDDWLNQELQDPQPRVREAALKTASGLLDRGTLQRIAKCAGEDADTDVRRAAAAVLAGADHPVAAGLLSDLLRHGDDGVRKAAFRGLRRIYGAADLRPLSQALDGPHADLGLEAVAALEQLAPQNDAARERLEAALQAGSREVRYAVLAALEKIAGDDPDPLLRAARGKHADLRRLGLIRAWQRKLLNRPAIGAMLRRSLEDADPEVRKTAFLASVAGREALATALRTRDPDLHKQLAELERTRPDGTAGPGGELPKAPRPAKGTPELTADDKAPLVQALAGRALDVCLEGARGLALLGDRTVLTLLLQLSRDEDPKARRETARALAVLDDPRSEQRLLTLLHDDARDVRDAAFSALLELYDDRPLAAVEAALFAPSSDVRSRGLQVLTQHIKKKTPPFPLDKSWELLRQALDDGEAAVRTEAFKVGLNLQVGGGGVESLRWLRQSVREEVRREVLTDAMGRTQEAGLAEFLAEFYDDPAPALRQETFDFALAQAKKQDLPVLERALKSRFPDLRLKVIERLAKRRSAAAGKILATALDDADRIVRRAALDVLISFAALDRLRESLTGPHEDVRIRAAAACARHGDPAAVPVLQAQLEVPQPDRKELVEPWKDLVLVALEGLGEAADPATVPALRKLLDDPATLPVLRQGAAAALARIDAPAALEACRGLLADGDALVATWAGLGTAWSGDPAGLVVVMNRKQSGKVPGDLLLGATFGLRERMFESFAALLDVAEEARRLPVVRLFLAWTWQEPTADLRKPLAMLSARDARTRLLGAELLEHAGDATETAALVLRGFVERDGQPDRKLAPATLAEVAAVLCFGPIRMQVEAIKLLPLLDAKDLDDWDHAWETFRKRRSGEIAAARAEAAKRTAPPAPALDERRTLALGAYFGLLREQGAAKNARTAALLTAVVRVRQTALRHLERLAGQDATAAAEIRTALLQALGDPHQDVRKQAYDALLRLGADKATVAAEALAGGKVDLGLAALKDLADGTSPEDARDLLIRTIRTREDELAPKAAELLAAEIGRPAAAKVLLDAQTAAVRGTGADWLTDEYSKSAEAQAALRGTLTSRWEDLRLRGLLALAKFKDEACLPAVAEAIARAKSPPEWQKLRPALEVFPHPQTGLRLVERIRTGDLRGEVEDQLLDLAGEYRFVELVEPGLDLYEAAATSRTGKRLLDGARQFVLTLSGFDQPILDPRDENPDRSWESKQHPRRADVFARLLALGIKVGDAELWEDQLQEIQWARDAAIDPVLLQGIAAFKETLRQDLVAAYGWRVKRRGTSPEPLRKLLEDADPTVRFFAAEGLALGGRPDGLNVLLASVDLLESVPHRRRAVAALGELADVRALDLLIRLASEDGHALQEAAAEAIGHLGKSDKAAEIARLLARLANGPSGIASQALVGLRRLDTHAGWEIIRKAVRGGDWRRTTCALAQLGWCKLPDVVPFLTEYLAVTEDEELREAAVGALVRLLGETSLEPYYALLRNPHADPREEFADKLPRLWAEGDPRRLLEALPFVGPELRLEIETALLSRPALPVEIVREALQHPDPRIVEVGAKLIGSVAADGTPAPTAPLPPPTPAAPVKAARKKAATKAAPAVASETPAPAGDTPSLAGELGEILRGWHAELLRLRDRERAGKLRPDSDLGRRYGAVTAATAALVGAAGKAGVGGDTIAALIADPTAPAATRMAALEVVPRVGMDEATFAASVACLTDPVLGRTATDALAACRPDRQADWLPQSLVQPATFQDLIHTDRRMGIDLGVMRVAAADAHRQAVVLADLVRRGERETLAAVLRDRQATETARLGAAEGLGRLAETSAESVLAEVAKKSDDEEFRAAVWRAWHRSRRIRKKAIAAAMAAG